MNENKRAFGWIPSVIDSSIQVYGAGNLSDSSVYSRKPTMGIIDQGSEGSCVSQACYEMYGFYMQNNFQKNNDITPTWVYSRRSNYPEYGMMCRDAFEILQNEGKIKSFASIESLNSVKHAILTYGSVLLAVKVYDSNIDNFWEGKKLQGGHAVCAIGYDKNFIYFKNSWGTSYGHNGLWKFPVSEFGSKVCEAWVITG